MLQRAAEALMRTHAAMGEAAAQLVGRDYEKRHTVSFEEAALTGGSMAAQKAETGEAHEPSLEDMARAARYMVEEALAVADGRCTVRSGCRWRSLCLLLRRRRRRSRSSRRKRRRRRSRKRRRRSRR